ncbi:hypothetical protein A1Q1_00937 [Trichosporon asahii var. asahii CBS 2479]|uniref:Uncharacterized protein n=1 Tax=Trichosporon asahii var. asahii (strain ATCC 90039 / CBS 2479 / JCM 2466 / KCTC 7840 / NBRC 103889/ NCYC 2677 / UAMH 7654) TaxID=1186058 RepID=J6EZ20_TRIAS|nr:hypothetical protein A1Q1_00937 [Trichosporon asahii var. asahii CBS 2479]EJT49924.1 hypothetical protein A1Q1_00937 [Trichosporon asahii var. asahii CBS 2479]
MPRRSSSPERKPSALSSDGEDIKPDTKAGTKAKRGGRIDAAARAALASAVIQRGVATALADIDAVSAEQVRSQLAGNRQNLRKAMESAAGDL